MCLLAWPLRRNEADVDFILSQNLHCFWYENHVPMQQVIGNGIYIPHFIYTYSNAGYITSVQGWDRTSAYIYIYTWNQFQRRFHLKVRSLSAHLNNGLWAFCTNWSHGKNSAILDGKKAWHPPLGHREQRKVKLKLKTYTGTRKSTFTLVTLQRCNISWENVSWKMKNLQTFVWLGVWRIPPVIQTSVNWSNLVQKAHYCKFS